MKFVIQRVTEASCTVDGNVTGAIQKGFLVLIGITLITFLFFFFVNPSFLCPCREARNGEPDV